MRREDKVGQFRLGIDPAPEWFMAAHRAGHVERHDWDGHLRVYVGVLVNGRGFFELGATVTRKLFNRYMQGAGRPLAK